ncbi:integrase core domain-containing protein [Ravibacter arvi]|uniref:integrase core domain-containing protein n=1 Tax=Ravibacter arvi TaxID=2051041 RepID=UPI003CD05EFE
MLFNLFRNHSYIRLLTTEWIEEYNQRRPHEALENMTPVEWKDWLVKKEKLQPRTV